MMTNYREEVKRLDKSLFWNNLLITHVFPIFCEYKIVGRSKSNKQNILRAAILLKFCARHPLNLLLGLGV